MDAMHVKVSQSRSGAAGAALVRHLFSCGVPKGPRYNYYFTAVISYELKDVSGSTIEIRGGIGNDNTYANTKKMDMAR